MKRILLMLVLCAGLLATAGAGHAADERGLYVDTFFGEILGNDAQENRLLSIAKNYGFEHLCLYDLTHSAFVNGTEEEWTNYPSLAAFIEKAKTQYGISKISLSGGKEETLDRFLQFDQGKQYGIDGVHLECEPWNGAPCPCKDQPQDDPFDDFACTISNFKETLDGYNAAQGKDIEFYVYLAYLREEYWGYMDEVAAALQDVTVFYVCYRYVTESSWPTIALYDETYKETLEKLLANEAFSLTIRPSFSLESNYMGAWFKQQPDKLQTLSAIEQRFQEGYAAETAPWNSRVTVSGSQFLGYSLLQDYVLGGEAGAIDILLLRKKGQE